MKTGRPSILTDELTDAICSRMAQGESLRSICRSEGMPALGTVFRWVASNELFREQYEAAMAQRTEAMFEEILEIADETAFDDVDTEHGVKANSEWISRSRLRVDARKWMLSKMLPKKYGDKITQEHTGVEGASLFADLLKAVDGSALKVVKDE